MNKAAQQAIRQLQVEEQNGCTIEDSNLIREHHINQKSITYKRRYQFWFSVIAWLICIVIDAARQLLKALPCNHFCGFQSVADLGLTMQFEILDTKFLKIVHCNSGQTVSTIGYKQSEVMVHDSLYSTASNCVQCQISSHTINPHHSAFVNGRANGYLP